MKSIHLPPLRFPHRLGPFLAIGWTASTLALAAQSLAPVPFPPPRLHSGQLLMTALKERKTTREFALTPLPDLLLGEILWAGFGINRPEKAGRTAPSTMNLQVIDVYVVRAEGVYLYNPTAHRLDPVANGDFRKRTGGQPSMTQAPVTLLYVADFAKMSRVDPAERLFYAAADTGFIGQNVYLYAASAGLGAVVRAIPDKPALAKALNLKPDQHLILAQTVGYPAP